MKTVTVMSIGVLFVAVSLVSLAPPAKGASIPQRVADLESAVAALQAQVAAQQTTINTLQSDLDAAESTIATLQSELDAAQPAIDFATDLEQCMSVDDTNTINGLVGPHVIFDGCNVHVRDGSGNTLGPVNGLGNLIIGYNEDFSQGDRTGSHNLVIGPNHNYSNFGGFVAGNSNTISGESSSVLGGQLNTASGLRSTVCGGGQNTASGGVATVSGGAQNTASGDSATVSGGAGLTANDPAEHLP
jgi:outer membrane murein-binding lipoprotein Lpp